MKKSAEELLHSMHTRDRGVMKTRPDTQSSPLLGPSMKDASMKIEQSVQNTRRRSDKTQIRRERVEWSRKEVDP
jgi:hypothetical protein